MSSYEMRESAEPTRSPLVLSRRSALFGGVGAAGLLLLDRAFSRRGSGIGIDPEAAYAAPSDGNQRSPIKLDLTDNFVTFQARQIGSTVKDIFVILDSSVIRTPKKAKGSRSFDAEVFFREYDPSTNSFRSDIVADLTDGNMTDMKRKLSAGSARASGIGIDFADTSGDLIRKPMLILVDYEPTSSVEKNHINDKETIGGLTVIRNIDGRIVDALARFTLMFGDQVIMEGDTSNGSDSATEAFLKASIIQISHN